METLSSKNAQRLSLFFFFFFFFFIITFSNSAVAFRPRRSTTEFIRKSCKATTYPRLCFSSLAVHATKIQTSPNLLAATALNVTLSSAKATANAMLRLSSARGLKPREASAMKDCVEEMSDSVDALRKSIAEMNTVKGNPANVDFKLVMSDIQTWVSAALTDENTCTEGFQFQGKSGSSGKLKSAVRVRIVNVAQLTSNALALINKYAIIHG